MNRKPPSPAAQPLLISFLLFALYVVLNIFNIFGALFGSSDFRTAADVGAFVSVILIGGSIAFAFIAILRLVSHVDRWANERYYDRVNQVPPVQTNQIPPVQHGGAVSNSDQFSRTYQPDERQLESRPEGVRRRDLRGSGDAPISW